MSYQPLVPVDATKITPVNVNAITAAWDSGTHAQGISFLNDGRTFLFVHGSAAAGAVQIVFDDIPDQYGRGDTASPSVAQGEEGLFGPFAPHLWNHVNSVQALPDNNDATIKYVAIRIANPS